MSASSAMPASHVQVKTDHCGRLAQGRYVAGVSQSLGERFRGPGFAQDCLCRPLCQDENYTAG
jgi:hypothetical protein